MENLNITNFVQILFLSEIMQFYYVHGQFFKLQLQKIVRMKSLISIYWEWWS